MKSEVKPSTLNTIALAFIGDAVYERYVREHVIKIGIRHADELHKAAVSYVRAEAQAYAVRKLIEASLTDEEAAVVRRARNHRNTAAKRAKAGKKDNDPMSDKYATAFEALVGHLYLSGEEERLDELVNEAISIIEDGMKK